MFTFLQESEIFRKHKLEIILIILATVIPLFSIILYFTDVAPQAQENNEIEFQDASATTKRDSYAIDVSGAVLNPDVYEVTPGARLKDAVTLAGGLSDQADSDYFFRNYNLARIVSDQEKIYIPSRQEVQTGLFAENAAVQQSTAPAPVLGASTEAARVSLSQAGLEELDTLPGVGAITAQKIIDNRPYNSIEDLLTRKIVGQSVYTKIKDYLDL